MQRPSTPYIPIALMCLTLLSACEQLGLDNSRAIEAEGKAVGAACRHAGRALEDCYQFNPKAPKSAVFAGWKEMNDYMTEQKLDVIKPTVPPALPKSKKKPAAESEEEEASGKTDAPKDAESSAPADKQAAAQGRDETEKADDEKSSTKPGAKDKKAASPPTN